MLGHHRGSPVDSVEDRHRSFLRYAAPLNSEDGEAGTGTTARVIYTPTSTYVFTGFTTRLTDKEADALRATEGCLRVYPEVILPLATTCSPAFLDLHLGNEGFWTRSRFGSEVVIGILDTGIVVA
ncbi:hypothetical protein QYE76_008705 [Lolium multiflorum]|uniref:Inhibitor I9 domain-containing protein n=1 Tax=Lolium multiflorum TaxID=4521 RepID=A0AAD8TTX3_LOLMU|nr:hypothetical protein QYE76_008705 [Lolium multiflorum]